jgi:hypothetical protein
MICDFPKKLKRRDLKKSGESDALESQGSGERPLPNSERGPCKQITGALLGRARAKRKTGQLPAVGTQSRMRSRDGGIDLRRAAA